MSDVASRMEDTAANRKSLALVALTYAVLIAIIWGVHGLYSGMGYETAFAYNSSITSWLKGFLYVADPLRIHTNTFYHLSYLTAKLFGMDGSYVPFQAIYATLWWARGLLVFLILREFFPNNVLLCYLSGALVLVHASDGALQWVGQMNQFGFMFWMLLAFYLLLRAFRTDAPIIAVALTLAACFFEQMSLFSYESQLFLLLFFPFTLFAFGLHWKKLSLISAAWYLVPAYYLELTVKKYLHSGGATYQEAVMRKNWGATSLMGDLWFNIVASLEFWKWPRPDIETQVILSLSAGAVLVCGGLALVALARESHQKRMFSETARAWWLLLAAGVGALVLSFPVYLLLDSARGLWRTQFLSGIGSSLMFTALLGLVSHRVPWQTAKVAILLVGGAAVAYCGSLTALQLGAFHRGIWERHRTAITEVLHIAPSVKRESVIVMTNIPRDNDPFGDDLWFDLAIRLIYPDIPVAGVYYYTDGTRAPGDALEAAGEQWKWDNVTGLRPEVDKAGLGNTVVVRYDRSGKGTLESVLPPFICQQACAGELYNPSAVITGTIAPSAARRYRLSSR